jgi:hypothetical protein
MKAIKKSPVLLLTTTGMAVLGAWSLGLVWLMGRLAKADGRPCANGGAPGSGGTHLVQARKRRPVAYRRRKLTPPTRTQCRHRCGWVGSSQYAENAHQRHCPARR